VFAGLEYIPEVPGNRAKLSQNHDSRKTVSATLSVLKWSLAIFRPRSSKVSVHNVLLCPFQWEARRSGVSLEFPEEENIPQVPGNRNEVGQNHDARMAISATLSVSKWSGPIFPPRSSKVSVQKVFLCPFWCNPRPSGVSLESAGQENIPQVSGNRDEVGQNYDACNAVSATICLLKWSGAIFRPRSSKVSLKKVLLYPFHCKPRLSGVSLESLGLEYIPEVLENRAKVCKNHDARKAVSATLSVLKLSGAIFRSKTSKVSVQKVFLCPFHFKPRSSVVSLESAGVENIPQVPGNRADVCQLRCA